ncbi:putative ATPase [Streptoalloteichus tenebrarius]|uniref:ATPase n=1 Tax=Streptoalloteichus tenebrarius (strain ATCC 17920 / DSM 40477 / JCM 4838 / CBS 697.72 / NBRC 16177 / NCIMB 11028 / NRRL B-12390 / A12253. 1 / ISP 5477) TaxID=1933 RepID=A0ABT1HTH7_STRSD|nr:tetratricopeptide repeat protein [Streptoalloteichus tenebrarius]MCP2258823.1 putative ATPase [Streptoalloteichus tenebrarius]BFE99493.1 tetratricopeptide repeat protein [Streptoalloteichus tenebrarius]
MSIFTSRPIPRSPPSPRQLPAPPPSFTNRDTELDQLDQWFDETRPGPLLVVVNGIGGIGKTALALHWLSRRASGLRDGQLFVDLAGFTPQKDPVAPSDVLGGFLRALGVAPEHVPAALPERTALFRTLTADSRLAVLLDNARSVAQVRPLVPPSPHSIVVITSRWRLSGLALDGAQFLDVEPLATDASVLLLSKVVGSRRVEQEPLPAQELAVLCGGLPIALSLLSARLAERPHWRLSRAAHALHDERRRLANLAADDQLSLKAVFDLSYHNLNPELARAYRLLALHPGPTFGLQAAAVILDTDEDEALRHVTGLVRTNLLDESPHERFRFHDLVRLDASQRAEAAEPAQHRDTVQRRVLDWYLEQTIAADLAVRPTRVRVGPGYDLAPAATPAFDSRDNALAWLDSEHTNLVHAVHLAAERHWNALVWQFCEAMWSVLVHRRPYQDWIALHQLAIQSARLDRNPVAEARMRCQLATAYLDLERFANAESECHQALRLARDHGHRPTEATALEQLGIAARGRGHLPEAVDHLRQAVALAHTQNQPRAVAMRRRWIGEILADLGHTDEAVQELTAARGLMAELGDLVGEARVLTSLGSTFHRAGDGAQATSFLDQAMANLSAHRSPYYEAEALTVLGEVAASRGDLSTAHDHWERAEQYYRGLGSPLADRLRERLSGSDPETPRHEPR